MPNQLILIYNFKLRFDRENKKIKKLNFSNENFAFKILEFKKLNLPNLKLIKALETSLDYSLDDKIRTNNFIINENLILYQQDQQ